MELQIYRFLAALGKLLNTVGWSEVLPLPAQTSVTVARAFNKTWIARFGSLEIITTDQEKKL
jgi:hypothetical protein